MVYLGFLEIIAMSEQTNLSRRQFIGVAGGLIGASVLVSHASLAEPPAKNTPKIKPEDFTIETQETDVLVIGGGAAGVFAATKANDAGAKVTMVVKGRVGSSGLTPFAKGVFAYDKDKETMSIDEFAEQINISSLKTSNPVFARQLAEHSYQYVEELKSWGFFDSPLCNHSLMVPIKKRNIDLFEQVMITHLLKENGRVVGASGFSFKENKIYHLNAKSVILCTGSGGFKPSGFPMCDLTHDGSIMAYNVGARISGKEWNDGHPGSDENSGSSYDNWHGQVEEIPHIAGIGLGHDLGVTMNYTAYTQGGPIYMGPPPGEAEAGKPSQPPKSENATQHNQNTKYPTGPYVPPGFNGNNGGRDQKPEGGLLSFFAPSKPRGPSGAQVGGSTSGMAIHKSEGLVPINDKGLSTLPGLYAAGDALASNLSGGIYVQGGGSITASAVQGGIAGEASAKESKALDILPISKQQLKTVEKEILAPLKRTNGYSPAWVTQELQSTMIPNFVLYIKKERMMQAALAYVEELKEHHAPMLMADDLHKLRLAHETNNMILSAEMKLKASMMRKESRCSHYRLDYPEMDDKNWLAWINIHKGENDEMILSKQPFDKWPELT